MSRRGRPDGTLGHESPQAADAFSGPSGLDRLRAVIGPGWHTALFDDAIVYFQFVFAGPPVPPEPE